MGELGRPTIALVIEPSTRGDRVQLWRHPPAQRPILWLELWATPYHGPLTLANVLQELHNTVLELMEEVAGARL